LTLSWDCQSVPEAAEPLTDAIDAFAGLIERPDRHTLAAAASTGWDKNGPLG